MRPSITSNEMSWTDGADIAGRVYPDLLKHSTQTHYIDPDAPASVDQQGRVQPGTWAKALTGVLRGSENYSYSEQWKGLPSPMFLRSDVLG